MTWRYLYQTIVKVFRTCRRSLKEPIFTAQPPRDERVSSCQQPGCSTLRSRYVDWNSRTKSVSNCHQSKAEMHHPSQPTPIEDEQYAAQPNFRHIYKHWLYYYPEELMLPKHPLMVPLPVPLQASISMKPRSLCPKMKRKSYPPLPCPNSRKSELPFPRLVLP